MRSVRFRKDEEQKHYRYKMEWGGAQKENMNSEENTGTYRVEMRKSKKSETKVKRELKRVRDGQRRSNICKIAFPLKKKNQNGE